MRLANPDSLLSAFRRWLVRWIELSPAPGEAWCLRCELNGGKTRVVPIHGWREHVEEHKERGSNRVGMQGCWSGVPDEPDVGDDDSFMGPSI